MLAEDAAGPIASLHLDGRHSQSIVAADTQTGADHLGRATSAAFLAEVVAHRAAETPFCIGIFGPAGSGKSSFVARLIASVERLNQAAENAGLATPFISNIAVARVEAEQGSPASSLMRQVAVALATTHPRLAAEASHAGIDPRFAAREAAERLNEVRQRLETERNTLDNLVGRQANLADSVLFDSAGSRIDTFARSKRGRIERNLRSFGVTGEPLTAYKEAVREAGEASGPGRWSDLLRAFWGYRGQGRLLVLTVALLLAAWGVGALIENQAKLVDTVRGSSERMGNLADWLDAAWPRLRLIKPLLELGAAVTLGLDVVRGLRFLQPIHRGVKLLRDDIDGRRRDLDGLLAHQTARVDALSREAERAAATAADAESRAGKASGPVAVASTGSGPVRDGDVARSFFGVLSSAMQDGASDRLASSASAAPSRVIVAIDGLDRLSSEEAAGFVRTTRAFLEAPGFVTILAADRQHLAAGFAEADPALAAATLGRVVQIPYSLGAESESWPQAGSFARALLELGAFHDQEVDSPDPAVSALDRPWTSGERAALEALAPLAGSTPRAVKRFVNLYRVARADPRVRDGSPKDLAALAVTLAMQAAGVPLGNVEAQADGPFEAELREARAAAGEALGETLTAQDGKRGVRTARTYTMAG